MNLYERIKKEDGERRNLYKKIVQEMIDDHHCNFCKNCTKVPHVEMGYDAGTDPYCNIHMKLMLNYEDGSECIFWEYNGKGI